MGARDEVAEPFSPTEDVDLLERSELLRGLLRLFVLLTAIIAVIALITGSYDRAVVSGIGGAVYLILLLGLDRWGPRRTGALCVIWYFVLASGAMASGDGIHDITMILVPAGMFVGCLLLPLQYATAVIVLPVLIVAVIGGIGVAGGHTTVPELIVALLLLVVSGVLVATIARSLRKMVLERKRAELSAVLSRKELEGRNESLMIVNELAHLLHTASDIEAISRETVAMLVRHHEPLMVAFLLLDESGTKLDLISDHGFTDAERKVGSVLPVEGTLSGLAIAGQRVVVSDDLARDGRAYRPVAESLVQRGANTALSIPLLYGGRAFGVVNLISPPGAMTPLDLDMFGAIGETVALAIANVRHVAGLEHLAFHDTLTDLPNRAGLHRRFEALLAPEANPGRMALILLDLNRFREINDALGHDVGDDLLVAIRARIQSAAANREIFRLGGDEFAIVIEGLERADDAVRAAAAILDELRQPFDVGAMSIDVGASAGVAVFPEDGRDGQGLLRCADVAVHHAKRAPRGVMRYSPAIDEHTPERLALVSELGRAIREGKLALHFQPKIALEGGAIVGFEALVRWPHPTRGLLSPAEFLPLAETGHLIDPLTWWVVERALLQLREWTRTEPEITMAVNLSVRNLLDHNFSERIEEIMSRVGIDPHLVEFELTETAVMTDPDAALSMLGRITATGARLAIDDFGTGFSSLTYLRRFPVSEIKIDRSFVSDIRTGEQSLAIVRATVLLARSLGLTVVAEGIEDGETAEALRTIGCDYAQGYYFARPAPAAEIRLSTTIH